MSFAQATLTDFARQLGLGRIVFSDNGVASLVFESMGTLFVEQADESVLVYLAKTHDRIETNTVRTALEMCHWRHNHPVDVNACLGANNQLVLSARIQEYEFDLPRLEQTLRLLSDLHAQLLEGTMT